MILTQGQTQVVQNAVSSTTASGGQIPSLEPVSPTAIMVYKEQEDRL